MKHLMRDSVSGSEFARLGIEYFEVQISTLSSGSDH
jgi:hypothetical protein